MFSIDNSKRILCVGMCVLDIIHVCDTYPVEDTDRRCRRGYWQRGGNASNNCTVLRNLGANCEFLGMLSESEAFKFIHDDCRKRGIYIENCPLTGQDPPFSSVLLNRANDSRTIIHSNSNFPILTFDHFKRMVLSNYSWVHFEGRNPDQTSRMIDMIREFNRGQEKPITISVELEKMKEELLILSNLVDCVFIGKDLALHMGWNSGKKAVESIRRICKSKNDIICTWGSEGSHCLSSSGDYSHIQPYTPGKIEDALGAGDTFCAAVIYGLDRLKLSLKAAVDLGNRIAGFKLGHTGYDAIRQFNLESSL